mmetsp:Transcript_73926/g.128203  ORF Transcript_73926/g.128203 Transcript_73926/m.128203 type:complete len:195 (+) Transcript_73926:65-649(+)
MINIVARLLKGAKPEEEYQRTLPGTTCVTVLKGEGQPLGATIHKNGEHIVFLRIHQSGFLTKAWNRQNPGKKLQPGCRLVSVNGIRESDSFTDVNYELWKAGKKVLEVMEGSLTDSLSQVCADECNTDTCAVCLQDVQTTTQLVELPCKHAFHEDCIGHWFAQGKATCPLCQSFVVVEHRVCDEVWPSTEACRH